MFDDDTGRTYFGGAWQERVDAALRSFDGDSIAITTYDRGAENYDDGAWTDTSWDDAVQRPYGGSRWDEIVEDPNYARIIGVDPDATHEQRSDLTRERVERWAAAYDTVTVRGGYWDDCEERFVDQFARMTQDTGIAISVDPDHSFEKYRGLVKIDEDHDWSEREKEEKRAKDTPTAVDYFDTEQPSFGPAAEYEHVRVAGA